MFYQKRYSDINILGGFFLSEKKRDPQDKIAIFIASVIGFFVVAHFLTAGTSSILLLGMFAELQKHESKANKGLLVYLEEKYDEEFQINEFDSSFLQTDFYGTAQPLDEPSKSFNVYGKPMEENTYQYTDDYIAVKWEKEVYEEIEPILKRSSSNHIYGTVNPLPSTDYENYENTTLPLYLFQKKYPNSFPVRVEVALAVSKWNKKDAIPRINHLMTELKKSKFNDFDIQVHFVDIDAFRTQDQFLEIIEQLGIDDLLTEYPFAVLQEIDFELDDAQQIPDIQKLLKTNNVK